MVKVLLVIIRLNNILRECVRFKGFSKKENTPRIDNMHIDEKQFVENSCHYYCKSFFSCNKTMKQLIFDY